VIGDIEELAAELQFAVLTADSEVPQQGRIGIDDSIRAKDIDALVTESCGRGLLERRCVEPALYCPFAWLQIWISKHVGA
jgi:hypothetical protein